MNQPRAIGPLIAALQATGSGDLGQAEIIREALRNLTGFDHGGSNGWLRWWKENAGQPVVRPAPKKPAETVPAEESPENDPEEPKAG